MCVWLKTALTEYAYTEFILYVHADKLKFAEMAEHANIEVKIALQSYQTFLSVS